MSRIGTFLRGLSGGRGGAGVRLLLYTRPDCHLCDEVKAQLRERFAGLPVEEVNVDEDPALTARFGNEVPVGFIGGEKAFKLRMEPRRLRRLIRQARRRPRLDGP